MIGPLAFEKDSPPYAARLRSMQEENRKLSKNLKKIVSSVKGLVEVSEMYNTANRLVSENLVNVSITHQRVLPVFFIVMNR